MVFFGKRGVAWYFLLELLIAIFVVFMFVSAGKLYGSKEGPYQIYMDRDVALLMNSFYDVNGNAVVTYPFNMSHYTLEIKDNKVNIFVFGKNLPDYTSYFVKSGAQELDIKIGSIKSPKLVKTGSIIELREGTKPVNINRQTCSGISAKEELKTFFVEADESSGSIKLSLKTLLEQFGSVKDEKKDANIIINIKKADKTRILMPVNPDEKNRKLACLIANSAADSLGLTNNIAIMPSEQKEGSSMIVSIELDEIAVLKQDIANAIYSGIEGYFK